MMVLHGAAIYKLNLERAKKPRVIRILSLCFADGLHPGVDDGLDRDILVE